MNEREIEKRFSGLKAFLPEGAFEQVLPYLLQYPLQIKITKERKTIKGDYRHPVPGKAYHRISINGTLNRYSFLITLLHEIAHLLAYVRFKNSIQPHGREWKFIFKEVLSDFVNSHFFPSDVHTALQKSLKNLKATTCSDINLDRALKNYDLRSASALLLEELPEQAQFMLKDGRCFQKIEKLRTRFRCRELKTGNLYFVSGRAEVQLVQFQTV